MATNDDEQQQAESVVRLLLAARYVDGNISHEENAEFQRQLDRLPWRSGTALSIFVMQQSAPVRKALESQDLKDKFIVQECSNFATPASRASVLLAIEAVLEADGIVPSESSYLRQIKMHMQRL